MLLRLSTLLATAALAFAAAPTQWEWVQPTPHRQSWRDLAVGPNALVGITDGLGGRDIYRTTDGENWERVPSPKTRGLSRLTYAGGNYVTVGNNGVILSSTDGYDWQTRRDNEPADCLLDIAFGNGRYVTVGYNAVAYYSSNLKDWKKLNWGAGFTVPEIEFGNGTFLAFGAKLLRSTDGEAWTELPIPTDVPAFRYFYRDIGFAFHNGKFFVSGPNGTASSTDGSTWTQVNFQEYRRLVSTPDALCAIGYSYLDRSTDGANFTRALEVPNSAYSPQLKSAASFNGHTTIVGESGLYFCSADAATWTELLKPIDYTHSQIAYGNNLFIRYGAEEGNFTSTDGETWQLNPTAPALETLAYGNNTWLGITPDNEAATSPDGATWTLHALPSPASGPILYAQNKFLVATDAGVLISSNGATWQFAPIPNAQSIRLIGFQNNLFCALTDTSAPATSPDGLTWTVHPAQPDMPAHHYAAGNGRFVGIAGFDMGMGYVTSSTDGVHWQRNVLINGSSFVFTSLTFADSFFVMTDLHGGIYYSTDGITWNGRLEAPQQFTAAAYGNGTWLAIGGDSILRATPQFTAKSAATLQLVQTAASTWNLVVSGSPGEKWQLQSAASVNAPWSNAQLVEIPLTGKLTVPMPAANASLFFRAVVAQP
jgi:hypothetical protein